MKHTLKEETDQFIAFVMMFIVGCVILLLSGCQVHQSKKYGTHVSMFSKGAYFENANGMGGSYDQEKAVGAVGSSIITGIITSGVENIVGSNIGGQLVDSKNTTTAAGVTKNLGNRTPTITTEGQTAIFAPTK